MSVAQHEKPHKANALIPSPGSECSRDEGLVFSQTTTAAPSLHDPNDSKEKVRATLGLFEKPHSFPLPDGYRQVGVVFEGLTVHGAARGNQQVESFEIALIKVRHLPRHVSESRDKTLQYAHLLIRGSPRTSSYTDVGHLQLRQTYLQLAHGTHTTAYFRLIRRRSRGGDDARSRSPRSGLLYPFEGVGKHSGTVC